MLRHTATVAITLFLALVGTAQAGQTPVLSVSGQTLTWTAGPNQHHFLVESVPPDPTQLVQVDQATYTPPTLPGVTVTFRVRPKCCSLWSNTKSIAYPPTVEEPPPTAPHVMVIVEENRNRSEVVGDPNMPYFNSLLQKYGNTLSWKGVAHPSLPNYLALASGSTQGVTDDSCEHSSSGATIGSQLTAAGIPWKAYMEGLPSAGSTTCTSGNYAKKHNPFAYFPGSNGPNVVPASQFSTSTLPSFVWYTPDLCADGHDCSNATVDASLKAIIAPVLTSPWYADNGTIIVTYDENAGVEGNGIATIVIHGAGYKSTLTASGTHYGTLATIEDLYKVPRLGNAAGVTSTLAPLLEAPKEEEPPPTGTAGKVKFRVDAKSYFDPFSGEVSWLQAHISLILGYATFADRYVKTGIPTLDYDDSFTRWGPLGLTAAHIAEVEGICRKEHERGYAGEFLDDVEFTSGFHQAGTPQQVSEMVEACRRGLGPNGILAINTQYADLHVRLSETWAAKAVAVVDQIDNEFALNTDGPIKSPTAFAEHSAYIDALHAKGIQVEQESVESGKPGDEYEVAGYLLDNNGEDYFGTYVTPPEWKPIYDANLGAALGGREQVGSAYRRRFALGTVYVNPPGASTTTVDGHSLSARSGLIVTP